MQDFIVAKREEIAELCRRHRVRHLGIFGSAVRNDFDPERSDVDLRIEFDDDAIERYAATTSSCRMHSRHSSNARSISSAARRFAILTSAMPLSRRK